MQWQDDRKLKRRADPLAAALPGKMTEVTRMQGCGQEQGTGQMRRDPQPSNTYTGISVCVVKRMGI